MSVKCKHCHKPREQHWIGSEGAFCSSADLPDYKLFGNIVSEVRFEPESVVDDAFRQLQQGNAVSCITPDGSRFKIQSKVDYGITWYRAFPARKGCLSRYSRLSDSELRQWLASVTVND